ncbi:protein insensitive-like [Bactrocera dorsalis]|uniref:Protein insensitive-like n=1 Tax=Bactrocera dorsalis TaxID=27457 RepID=A0ABM3JFE1_BACDO|nr:protein insensitive-like [Bactrocera dorsalis]
MDSSMNSTVNYGNTNESSESALDLRQIPAISTITGGRRPIYDFPDLKTRKKTGNKRSSAADFQLKRRREFDIRYNGVVKTPKLNQTTSPAREEAPRVDIERPTVQTPRNIGSLMRHLQARFPTNFVNGLPNRLNSGIISNPHSTVATIAARPINNADASNIENNLEESPYVQIGPHGTRVSKVDLASINWTEASLATRKLLTFLFDRQTLATHTLSGKLSPAFRDRQLKAQLDPLKVADIKHYVKQKTNCSEREIRSAITNKCADTAKAIRRRRMSKVKLETSL